MSPWVWSQRLRPGTRPLPVKPRSWHPRWQPVAPSAVAFEGYATPRELDASELPDIVAAFARAEAPPLTPPDTDYKAPSLARAEWEHINRVLSDCGGNISEAARRLGIHRQLLYRKMAQYGLD